MIKKKNIFLLLIPLLFLFLFFYFPLSTVLIRGVTDGAGNFDLQTIGEILGSPYYRRVIGFTVFQAFLSSLFSLLLGIPGAYILSHHTFPAKKLVTAFTTVPFVLPSILVVLGFVLLFGNNGYINRFFMTVFDLDSPPLHILYSMKAIILAHSFYNFPICLRIIAGVWENASGSTVFAARNLGAKGPKLFFSVTLPQIAPGILSSGILVFLFCYLSFAVILVLGGGPQYTTMEVEIYRLAKFSLDFSKASSLAVLQIAVSLLVLYSYLKIQQLTTFKERHNSLPMIPAPLSKKNRIVKRAAIGGYSSVVVFLIFLPIITVVAQSFLRKNGWSGRAELTLHWYKTLLRPEGVALFSKEAAISVFNSIWIAAGATAASVVAGCLFAFISKRNTILSQRFSETFVMLPMGVSSIILGLGMIRAARMTNLSSGSFFLILIAHTVIAYPFVLRSITAVYGKLHPSIIEAAGGLGASPARVFRLIELPLIRSGLMTGAAFAFAISVGEINATLLLAPRTIATIPITMYRLISSYNFSGACALGTILMIVCTAAFLVIETLGETKEPRI